MGGVKLGSAMGKFLLGREIIITLEYSMSHPRTKRRHNADPDWVVVEIFPPSGTITRLRWAPGRTSEIERLAEGVFVARFTPTETGVHKYKVTTNGGGGPGEWGEFTVG